MKNSDLILFNLAINFAKDSANQNSPSTILTLMGFTPLEWRVIVNRSGYIIRTEYLLLTGEIVTVKRLAKNKLKATIK